MIKQVSGLISLSAIILLSACKTQEAPKQNARPLPVVEVELRDVTGYSVYPTSIEGIVNNEVRAKISGYIEEVYVDEGQYVQAGQALFRLETNMIGQNAAAARSGVDAAESAIKAAQSSVDAAQLEVNRLIPLVEKNIISNVQLETAQANLLRAQSQLEQARAAYHQAMANYKSAQANVDYSIIRAPVSGVVGKINFRKGALVGPSDPMPITTVSDTRELYAYFSMNEAEYLNFLEQTPGKTLSEKLKNLPFAELELANGSRYPEKGKIEAVTGQINAKTGTVQFRVSFTNKDGILTNGNSGRLLIPRQYDNVLVMPESGTYEQQGYVYAYRVENDTAKSVILDVISRVDNLVLIKSGVQQGDKVVGAGVGNLRNNTPITPIPVSIDSLTNNIKAIF